MIQETASRVGSDFGVDYWRAKDAAHEFPRELWQAVCDTGLCGTALPEAYGGSGLGMLELVLAIEELAAAGAGSTVGQLFILNPVFGGVALAEHGQEQARREYLPKMVSGEMRFCMALTEPDAGINTTNIKTFATPHLFRLEDQRTQDLDHGGARLAQDAGGGPHAQARRGRSARRTASRCS